MSQEKVDKYKKEKANRKKTLARNKVKKKKKEKKVITNTVVGYAAIQLLDLIIKFIESVVK